MNSRTRTIDIMKCMVIEWACTKVQYYKPPKSMRGKKCGVLSVRLGAAAAARYGCVGSPWRAAAPPSRRLSVAPPRRLRRRLDSIMIQQLALCVSAF